MVSLSAIYRPEILAINRTGVENVKPGTTSEKLKSLELIWW
jgi:hypothetical protein